MGVKEERGTVRETRKGAIGTREIAERDLIALAAADRPGIQDRRYGAGHPND